MDTSLTDEQLSEVTHDLIEHLEGSDDAPGLVPHKNQQFAVLFGAILLLARKHEINKTMIVKRFREFWTANKKRLL